MALEISYSPLFFENLEAILKFFDERNGSDNFRVTRCQARCVKTLLGSFFSIVIANQV